MIKAVKEAEIVSKGNAAQVALEAITDVAEEIRSGIYIKFQELTDKDDFLPVQAELKALNMIEKKLQQAVAKGNNVVAESKRKAFRPLKPLDGE